MKIIMNEDGRVVGRHADGDDIQPRHYAQHGAVLVGIIDDRLWSQNNIGEDVVNGSVIDVARDLARQMVRAKVAQMLAELREDYPQEERDTWPTKIAEANAILAGGKLEETIYLAAVVNATGGDPTAIAKSVIRKATAYAERVAIAEAYRTTRYEAIDKARNIEAIVAALGG